MVQRTISRVAVPRIIHHRSVSKSIVWSSFSIIYYQNGHNLRVHPFSEHVFFFPNNPTSRTLAAPPATVVWATRTPSRTISMQRTRALWQGALQALRHGFTAGKGHMTWGVLGMRKPFNWAGGKGRFCRYLYVFLCWVLIFLNIFFGLASPFNEDLLREYGDFNGVFITFMMNKWWPNP